MDRTVMALISLSGMMLAGGGPARAADFSYTDLVQTIQSKGITSLEDLLPELPQAMRTRYVMMRESRSLQGASQAAPRIIMFGEHASLTCAFNGDASEAGYDTLECFQFSKDERRFDFRQIQFPTAANGATAVRFSDSGKTVDGSRSCSECHGADPRPNWDQYSRWPGAFGEEDDELGDDQTAYATLAQNAPNHPRYRALTFDTSDAGPYHFDHDTQRPNLFFSDLLGKMNGYRGARLLETTVKPWEALGFAVSALGCKLTDDQQKQVTAAGKNYADDVSLDRIFKASGAEVRAWGTEIFGDTSSYPEYEHQAGFGFLTEDVAMAMLVERAQANAVLADGISKMVAYYTTGRAGDLDYFTALNDILPDPDHFDGLEQNTALVCPEAVRLFLAAYL